MFVEGPVTILGGQIRILKVNILLPHILPMDPLGYFLRHTVLGTALEVGHKDGMPALWTITPAFLILCTLE